MSEKVVLRGRAYRTIYAVVVPHEVAQDRLQNRVPHHHPDGKAQLPDGRRGRHAAGKRGRLGLLGGFGSRLVGLGVPRRGPEPAAVLLDELGHGGAMMQAGAADEEVEVAEAPGGEAEAGDAEEGVEDLGVDFEPDLARGGGVVGGGVAHGGRGVEEEEEEHGLGREG